eukprot:CCRYP_016345-RA/>CCRYP_016345-RA protein AED:0.47 eAED:0.47 QI:0/-1/0/1/-1/0/1/0/49
MAIVTFPSNLMSIGLLEDGFQRSERNIVSILTSKIMVNQVTISSFASNV